MIELITGLPGNGKTLYALWRVVDRAKKENRPVYYSGISDLNLGWTEIDPAKWMDCPANSIIIIDECQRIFRPRMHGTKVPDYVEALETHRHKGVDLVFITQHPMLVDSNVRRLVGLHFHCVRKFGTQASTVHEWASVKENCDKNRDESTRHDFKFPKEAYAWYKSAEVHTHKARIPARVWVLLSVVLAIPALGFYQYQKMSGAPAGDPPAVSPSASAPVVAAVGQQNQPDISAVENYRPRISGLPWTAPVYDKVTQVVRAPYPAACVMSKARCVCYTQQGTRLDVSIELCQGIARGGFFMAWDDPVTAGPVQAVARSDTDSQPPLGGYLNLTPGSGDRVVPDQADVADRARQDGEGIRAARHVRR
jgi:zona occludens toxin